MQANQTTTEQPPCMLRRADLHLVLPPPDDGESWQRLMNFMFIHEHDELFRWLRTVRAVVEASE